jgi:hypothetical protein
MPLTQESIDKLKEIHKDECGEDLTDAEAWDMGIRLVNIMKSFSKIEQSKVSDN